MMIAAVFLGDRNGERVAVTPLWYQLPGFKNIIFSEAAPASHYRLVVLEDEHGS